MNNEFYINNLSYSQLRTFISNTGEWQNNRLLSIYDNTIGIAGAVGIIVHKFIETYLLYGNIDDAIDVSNKCIYDGPDGRTYIIAPELNTEDVDFEALKENYGTKVIDFGKTGSNEVLLKKIEAGRNAFLSEQINWGKPVGIEKSMTHTAKEVLGNKLVESPIPFQAKSDYIGRTTEVRNILTNGELQNIPVGSLFLEDYKMKDKHTEMSEEDPKYIFQAMFNYYCVVAEFGEKPLFMEFREIKTSKNSDGSSQHQTITIPFFGPVFEEYKVYFWRYLIEVFHRIVRIQDRDFLFNIFDPLNGNKEWEKQKAFYLGVKVGELKSRIAMTQKNRIASNVPVMGDRDPFIKAKRVKGDMNVEDLNSIENKIRTAFRNFGIVVNFEKKLDGYSFDQYLFSTARGTKMLEVKKLLPEIYQALELEKGARIEAPVLGTKFIGVEIPREERRFAKLDKLKKDKKPIIPIGVNINGDKEFIDLSDPDTSHLLIAGQTGSGKSEFLKTAIYSLTGKGKIYLVDPKKVGLIKFKNVAEEFITNMGDLALSLEKFLAEMYATYQKLSDLGAESIYETKLRIKETFIVIDELASIAHDPTYGKDMIATIGQLANLGRAAGFHLIIATQRPDIKVIPGNIKANISTRICFALATKIDSKVVLDEEGAEQLLGKGDMLFMNRGIKRLQGFYI